MKLSRYLKPSEIDELIEPVCLLANLDLSEEGGHVDLQMDALILAARHIRDREGFLVVDDENEINAIQQTPGA